MLLDRGILFLVGGGLSDISVVMASALRRVRGLVGE